MAGFSDASRWVKIGFFLNVAGLVLELLLSLQPIPSYLEILQCLAVIFFFLTTSLSFTWGFISEAKDNKGIHISTLVFGFITALICLVSGVFHGIDGVRLHPIISSALATFFALMAAIFACVEVAGDVKVTLPKIPSPRKAKKPKAEKDVEAGEAEKKEEEAVELEESAKEAKNEETKEDDKKEDGATNGQVVKEEEGQKEEAKEEENKEETEQKDEGDQKAEEKKD